VVDVTIFSFAEEPSKAVAEGPRMGDVEPPEKIVVAVASSVPS
jgi:hypothetical protein